jgi:RNA 2',3'-cyclic 3'-phosphodiesterase
MLQAGSFTAQLSLPGLEAKATDGLFFAILPDVAASGGTLNIAERWRDEYGLEGRPFASHRLHVSLLGVGEYAGLPRDVVARGHEAVAGIAAAPFEIRFDRIGSFNGVPGNWPLVLFADRAATALKALRRSLAQTLARAGLRARGRRAYTPHMTLLYDARWIEAQAVEPISWTAREFVLVHSLLGRGRHIVLGRWPLRGGN